jgi:hypothetical protein
MNGAPERRVDAPLPMRHQLFRGAEAYEPSPVL